MFDSWQRLYFVQQSNQTGSGVHPMGTGISLLSVKRPGRKADDSP